MAASEEMGSREVALQRLEQRQTWILQRVADLEQIVSALLLQKNKSSSPSSHPSSEVACFREGETVKLTEKVPLVHTRITQGNGVKGNADSGQLEHARSKTTTSTDANGHLDNENQNGLPEPLALSQTPTITETQQRLEKITRSLGCHSIQFKAVPEDYYERSLEERRDMLGAASVDHLCKSIVMTNTQAPAEITDCSNPKNSKYYVVVVQYVARLNTEKVKNFVHSLNEGKLPKKRINMRLAPSEISDELTGYTHNSVTPFGMRTDIPVILSDAITKLSPPFFWLGAGEVHLKLGLQVSEFIDGIKPFIADCT